MHNLHIAQLHTLYAYVNIQEYKIFAQHIYVQLYMHAQQINSEE